MARTKAFDRDTALQAATLVFWKQGFEATSTDDLMRAMNIGRQSLYDTFGDKRRLYLEALRRYNAASVTNWLSYLQTDSSPLAALEEMLCAIAAETTEQRALGCMGVNAVCEFGQSDPEVLALGKASGRMLTAALVGIVREAKARGEVPASLDEDGAAQFIHATLVGMKVSAKGGASPDTLRTIAHLAVNGLKAK